MTNQQYSIIILAAGSSSRMGTSKQMLPINDIPLLVRTVTTAVQVNAGRTIVVLGHQENEHRNLLNNLPVEILSNSHWQSGIGSSIKAALSELLEKEIEYQGVIFVVCDQPHLSSDHLLRLIEEHRASQRPIVASHYSGTVGVPVLFGQKYFPALLQVPNQYGAKLVIEKHAEDVAIVEFEHGEIDLDTIEDYQTFLKQTNL